MIYSYAISEIYACPLPSTTGIPEGQYFVYESYPYKLNPELFGTIQPTKILVSSADNSYHFKGNILSQNYAYLMSSKVLGNMYKKYLNHANQSSQSNEKLAYATSKSFDVDEWIIDNYRHFQKLCKVFQTFQIKYLYSKRHRLFICKLQALKKIKSCIKVFLFKKRVHVRVFLSKVKKQVSFVIKLQSYIRMFREKIKSKKIRYVVITIQSLIRMIQAKRSYTKLCHSVNLINKIVKAYCVRKTMYKARLMLLSRYVFQICQLWLLEFSPLHHRSSFITSLNILPSSPNTIDLFDCRFESGLIAIPQFNGISYLNLALCEEELKRLYEVMDFFSVAALRILKNGKFEDTFKCIEKQFSTVIAHADNQIELFNKKINRSTSWMPSSNVILYINNNKIKEEMERRDLYLALKSLPEVDKLCIYQSYNLRPQRKRKQTLSNSIWMIFMSFQEILNSAYVYNAIHKKKIGSVYLQSYNGLSTECFSLEPIEYRKLVRMKSLLREILIKNS